MHVKGQKWAFILIFFLVALALGFATGSAGALPKTLCLTAGPARPVSSPAT